MFAASCLLLLITAWLTLTSWGYGPWRLCSIRLLDLFFNALKIHYNAKKKIYIADKMHGYIFFNVQQALYGEELEVGRVFDSMTSVDAGPDSED